MGARLAFLLPLIVATMLTGCGGGQVLLQAEFDDETVGELPDASLPGSPEGDLLYFQPVSIFDRPLDSSAVLVASTGDPPPGLSLRHNIGYTDPWVVFRAATAPSGIGTYLLTWMGAANIPREAELQILLMSGHRNPGVSLRMSGGQFVIGEDEEPLGSYTHLQEHTVLIAVDLNAGTYNLTIHRTGASNLQVLDRPLSGDLGASSVLELSFVWTGTASGGIFYVDNVVIRGGE